MNAIKMLKQQHSDVHEIFARLAAADDKAAATRRAIFGRLARALSLHGQLEERIFYPAASTLKTEDLLERSLDEHARIDSLVARLLALDPNSVEFEELCVELHERVTAHIEEEETLLFPVVEKLFDEDELEALGDALDELADDLGSGQGPTSDGPDQSVGRPNTYQ
jgi:hemerythrin superfamily protein